MEPFKKDLLKMKDLLVELLTHLTALISSLRTPKQKSISSFNMYTNLSRVILVHNVRNLQKKYNFVKFKIKHRNLIKRAILCDIKFDCRNKLLTKCRLTEQYSFQGRWRQNSYFLLLNVKYKNNRKCFNFHLKILHSKYIFLTPTPRNPLSNALIQPNLALCYAF